MTINIDCPVGTWNCQSTEATLSVADFHKAQDALVKANIPMTNLYLSIPPVEETVPAMADFTLFDDLDEEDDEDYCCDECWAQQEKEKTMYSNANVQVTEIQASPEKDYLRREGEKTYREMDLTLERKFGLVNDDRPMTATDIVARIQAGKFILDAKYKDEYTYGAADYITWRDPAIKEDKDGYKAAEKLLKAAYRTAKDVIEVKTPAEGLDALVAFRSTTIQ